MMEGEKPKKKRVRKPGQWSPFDIVLAIVGIVILISLTVAAFKVAKWAMETYF